MENTFLPLIFRMKHINRWSLMHNTQQEDLMQHTIECAFIANYLATIGNCYFGKNHDINKLTVCAMFHDITEVLTGDLPTPIKYFNNDIKNIYSQIEDMATEKLKKHLPADIVPYYDNYLNKAKLSVEEGMLIKAADKLCAYIKCIHELNAGNKEFQHAYARTKAVLKSYDCEELRYFLDNCVDAFSFSLYDLKGTLD